MKTLITISAFLVVATTNLFAQNNSAIEIKNQELKVINGNGNQFKLFSHEELEVELKFDLKKSESLIVVVLDDANHIVYTKKIEKEGKNKIYFTTEEEEEYTVKVYTEKEANLIAVLDK